MVAILLFLAIIISLLYAHSHYSIDIYGIIFAYAINSFGNKYFKIFELNNTDKSMLTELSTRMLKNSNQIHPSN